MTFDEAEARFRELQARVQRGEPISRAEYEDQVSQLAVQDDRGVLWEINPRTGKWMYFDGAEWVGGIPPGRDTSTVMPLPRGPGASSAASSSGVRPSPPTSPPTFSSPAAPPPSAPPPQTPGMSPSPRPATRFGDSSPAPRTTVPITTSARPTVPTGAPAPAPRASPPSPESVPPYKRVTPGKGTGALPADAPRGEAAPKQGLRQGPLGGPNREWVPLAIGAVVLLFCAILLFVGGRFVLSMMPGQAASPTVRPTTLALATNTPVPTAVRLPTQPLAPPTPVPVVAKVVEASVNVRAGPSTSSKILSKLKKDNTISPTGRSADGKWFQITITGSSAPGWVFGETIQFTSGDPNSLNVVGAGAPTATKAAAPATPRSGAATPTVIGARP